MYVGPDKRSPVRTSTKYARGVTELFTHLLAGGKVSFAKALNLVEYSILLMSSRLC